MGGSWARIEAGSVIGSGPSSGGNLCEPNQLRSEDCREQAGEQAEGEESRNAMRRPPPRVRRPFAAWFCMPCRPSFRCAAQKSTVMYFSQPNFILLASTILACRSMLFGSLLESAEYIATAFLKRN